MTGIARNVIDRDIVFDANSPLLESDFNRIILNAVYVVVTNYTQFSLDISKECYLVSNVRRRIY